MDDLTATIESSIAGMDAGGDTAPAAAPSEPAAPASPVGPASGGVSPAAGAATPPAAAPAPPAQDPAAAPPADPAVPTGKKGKFVPLDRHESSIAAAREEGSRQAATQYAAKTAEYEGQIQNLRTEIDTRFEAINLLATDPGKFFQALAQADPNVRQYLNLGALGGQAAPAAAAAPASSYTPPGALDPNEPMPEPDSPDGYTPQGLRKLMEWNSRVTEARLAKRYESLETTHHAERARTAAREKVGRQVSDFLTWPGAADEANQQAIAATMRATPGLSLEAAYRRVVLSKLQVDRDVMRRELLAEANGKPKHVSITAPGATPAAVSATDDLIAVINASIAGIPG